MSAICTTRGVPFAPSAGAAKDPESKRRKLEQQLAQIRRESEEMWAQHDEQQQRRRSRRRNRSAKGVQR